jgi:cobalt/nickel transport system permease protein
MHIPDGFLNLPVITGTYAVTVSTFGIMHRKIKDQFGEQSIPKLSLLAAFLFVAQMINIPVSTGTSAHLVGATLALLLAGPFVAVFIMALVLTIQMLIFQDGGLSAWGANVFNLAIVPIFVSYGSLHLLGRMVKAKIRITPVSQTIIFFSTWISLQISAFMCSLELALSELAPLENILSLMLLIHAMAGLLEGLLTVMIYQAIRSARPDILYYRPLQLMSQS